MFQRISLKKKGIHMKKRTIETIEEFNDQGRLIWKSVTETTECDDKMTDVPQENTVCSCFHPEEIGDRCYGTKVRESFVPVAVTSRVLFFMILKRSE